MTNEQIIEMAKQAGWAEIGADLWGATHDGAMSIYALQRFAQLVRNAALEDAIGAVDKLADAVITTQPQQFALDVAADKIRSLKS